MKTLYIDMDNVLVDFSSGIEQLSEETRSSYADNLDEVHGIFGLMRPMTGAIEAAELLARHFNIYILSTAAWENPSAWSDKVIWIQKHLPKIGYKRLILSHNKHLNIGDYLIDDRPNNGAKDFNGEWIHFGQNGFEGWNEVVSYLLEKEGLKE
jgi:5'(3')-deoxyribonucleotidase